MTLHHDTMVVLLSQMEASTETVISMLCLLTEECIRQLADPHWAFAHHLETMRRLRMSADLDRKEFMRRLADRNSEIVIDEAIREINGPEPPD